MLRQALSEVRLHLGRYVSTLLAIAISVAFLAGAPTVVSTQANAAGMAQSAYLGKADAVVEAPPEAAKKLAEVSGVDAWSPLTNWGGVTRTSTGEYTLVSLWQLPPEQLRWTGLSVGTWPSARDEVALTTDLATSLGVKVGDSFRTEDGPKLKVVGLLSQPGSPMLGGVAAPALFEGTEASEWIFAAKPGVSPEALAASLRTAVAVYDDTTVSTGEQARAKAIKSASGGVDTFTYLLLGFAAVALVVGMITVANTFTITLAQRRRQIGLLRAVGASGGQLRSRFAWEAALLAVIGSVLGIGLGLGAAAAVSAVLGTLAWGLVLPWPWLFASLGIGVLATLTAAWLPIVRSTRVAPLEALQPVAGADELRRASRVRAVVCGGLVVLGGLAAVAAVAFAGRSAFFVAVASGVLIAAGVLFGAPLFVPPLLRWAGRTFRWAGPVAGLAADNAERNPRRAATTASALMLAIGLMVTLQVGTASMKATSLAQIAEHYPIDVQVTWSPEGKLASIPSDARTRLAAVPGVTASALLPAAMVMAYDGTDEASRWRAFAWEPAAEAVTSERPVIGADQVLVSPSAFEKPPKSLKVTGGRGSATLTLVESRLVPPNQLMVAPATLAALARPVPDAVAWLAVPDRGRAVSVTAEVTGIVGSSGELDGSLIQSAALEQVIDLLLAITTGLLGIAVLIALIGVSNTLGLSVIERTRESALLRALGLQSRSLRLMLMIEAIQVALVGVVVGILAGAFFGWLAVTSLGRSSGFDSVRFAVDVPQTLAMVALAVLAAALASVLPGRRAAKAVPVDALADI